MSANPTDPLDDDGLDLQSVDDEAWEVFLLDEDEEAEPEQGDFLGEIEQDDVETGDFE